MANEATISASLRVLKGNIDYRSNPASFAGDVTGTAGPTPGLVVVTKQGVDIDFSALTEPGYATVHNISQAHAVELGNYDGTVGTGTFYPFMEILPGEIYPIRFARNLTEEFGTATATQTADVTTIRARSLDPNGGDVNIVVEAFET